MPSLYLWLIVLVLLNSSWLKFSWKTADPVYFLHFNDDCLVGPTPGIPLGTHSFCSPSCVSCANDTRFFGLILLGVVVSCFGWDDGPSDDEEEEHDDNDEDRVYVGVELCEIG